jgi:hypothetical protein
VDRIDVGTNLDDIANKIMGKAHEMTGEIAQHAKPAGLQP